MKKKIPLCSNCRKICKRGEYHETYGEGIGLCGEYLSDCCNCGIIYFDDIKEVILDALED